MHPVGILLAAGRGRRFDPEGRRNKLLQRLPAGDPVVVASARHLLAVLPRVIAVVPAADGGVAAALRALGCEVTVCEQAATGMAASLVHAIRQSLPDADAWLVALGDMPYVAPDLAVLSKRLEDQQRSRDPQLQVVTNKSIDLKGHTLQQLDSIISAKGQTAYSSVVLGKVDNKLLTIQITLPADDQQKAQTAAENIINTLVIQ